MKKTCPHVRTLLLTHHQVVVWEGDLGSTVFGDFDPGVGNHCWQGACVRATAFFPLFFYPLIVGPVRRCSSADIFPFISDSL